MSTYVEFPEIPKLPQLKPELYDAVIDILTKSFNEIVETYIKIFFDFTDVNHLGRWNLLGISFNGDVYERNPEFSKKFVGVLQRMHKSLFSEKSMLQTVEDYGLNKPGESLQTKLSRVLEQRKVEKPSLIDEDVPVPAAALRRKIPRNLKQGQI